MTPIHAALVRLNAAPQKIVVSPTSKRGKCDVVLHGALAPILQYASAPDEGGTKSSNVGRVLLVAGVGFAQKHTLRKTI